MQCVSYLSVLYIYTCWPLWSCTLCASESMMSVARRLLGRQARSVVHVWPVSTLHFIYTPALSPRQLIVAWLLSVAKRVRLVASVCCCYSVCHCVCVSVCNVHITCSVSIGRLSWLVVCHQCLCMHLQ